MASGRLMDLSPGRLYSQRPAPLKPGHWSGRRRPLVEAGAAATLLGRLRRGLRHLVHHGVEVERRRLLARRELLEARDPLGRDGLSGNEDEHSIGKPLVVEDALRATLEGIRTDVVDHWQAK